MCADFVTTGEGTTRRRAARLYRRRVADLLSQRSARRLLERHGWTMTAGGKHAIKMEKPGHRPITLPHHHGEDYSRGLSAAVRKQAGLD
jgi:predicted RNA binding protein YcfA (HicA-like mRNA interferase family)